MLTLYTRHFRRLLASMAARFARRRASFSHRSRSSLPVHACFLYMPFFLLFASTLPVHLTALCRVRLSLSAFNSRDSARALWNETLPWCQNVRRAGSVIFSRKTFVSRVSFVFVGLVAHNLHETFPG